MQDSLTKMWQSGIKRHELQWWGLIMLFFYEPNV